MLDKFLIKRFLNSNRKLIREKLPVNDPKTQRARDYQKKVLSKKAREYLPYRLDYLANLHGYSYAKCRLTHANTRWGSCSSNKTISLNIGLMKVPEVLRDYVILHELAHLNHMDHSKAFWAEVGSHDQRYKIHEKKLKQYLIKAFLSEISKILPNKMVFYSRLFTSNLKNAKKN